MIISLIIVIIVAVGMMIYLKGRKPVNTNNDKVNTLKEKEYPQLSKEELKKRNIMLSETNAIYDNALKTNNPQECMKINIVANRNSCIEGFALKKGDEEACTLISDEVEKKKCLDTIAAKKLLDGNDIGKCKDLDKDLMIRACIARIVLQQNFTEEKCNNPDKTLSEICKDSVYFNKAITTKNSKLCSNILNKDIQNECLSVFRQ